MSTLIVLAGGQATRLFGLYKPNLLLAGKRMIEWQRKAVNADRTVIVHHESQNYPEPGCHMVPVSYETSGGPAQGLQLALALCQSHDHVVAEPVIVTLADTWWRHTPDGTDWVGVCPAQGGRSWDYPQGDSYTRSFVPNNRRLAVCVGLYGFGSMPALKSAVDRAMDTRAEEREVSMAEVLHFYEPELLNVEIPEWLDVGDSEAWTAADKHMRSIVG